MKAGQWTLYWVSHFHTSAIIILIDVSGQAWHRQRNVRICTPWSADRRTIFAFSSTLLWFVQIGWYGSFAVFWWIIGNRWQLCTAFLARVWPQSQLSFRLLLCLMPVDRLTCTGTIPNLLYTFGQFVNQVSSRVILVNIFIPGGAFGAQPLQWHLRCHLTWEATIST